MFYVRIWNEDDQIYIYDDLHDLYDLFTDYDELLKEVPSFLDQFYGQLDIPFAGYWSVYGILQLLDESLNTHYVEKAESYYVEAKVQEIKDALSRVDTVTIGDGFCTIATSKEKLDF